MRCARHLEWAGAAGVPARSIDKARSERCSEPSWPDSRLCGTTDGPDIAEKTAGKAQDKLHKK